MVDRRYDLVLYGATGFVGRLAAAYLALHTERIRWAVGGRDLRKLEALRARLATAPNPPDVLIADSADHLAVDTMAAQTRALISTAGPYALYGDAVVDACVRQRTHYADITGETVWVRRLIDRHHAQAERDGTRIVPFCGFDSIPSDLGTWLLVRHMQQQLRASPIEVRAYFRLAGGFNGGTLASNFARHALGDAVRSRDPFLLDPDPRHAFDEIEANLDPTGPHFEPHLDAWVAPFIMGPINTRVVRRSAALSAMWGEPYGDPFRYQEYTQFTGPLTGAKSAAVSVASAVFDAGAAFAPTRRLLSKVLTPPGEGPSELMMDRGWFRTELRGRTTDGASAGAVISFRGDPGNRATLRMLCESGLLLACHADALPGAPTRGGVLTPATAFGELLVPRLRAAGFGIDVGTA